MIWLWLAFVGGLDFLSFPDAPPVPGTGVSALRWWAGASILRADVIQNPWRGGLRYFDFGEFAFQGRVPLENPVSFRPFALEGWMGRTVPMDPRLSLTPALGAYLFSTPEYRLQGVFLHLTFRYRLEDPRVSLPVVPVLSGGVRYLGLSPQAYAELVDLPQVFFLRLTVPHPRLRVAVFWRSVQAYGTRTWFEGPGVERGVEAVYRDPRFQVGLEFRDGRELDPFRGFLAVPYGPWVVYYRHTFTRSVEDLMQIGVLYHGRSGF